MKIAHLADLHITGKQNETHATLDEQQEMLFWIGKHASEAGVKTILVAGDIFDGASTPEERSVFANVLAHWTSYELKIICARGNHDRPLDLLLFNRLKGDIWITENPGTYTFGPGMVHCLPWPSKAMFAASTGKTDRTEIDAGALTALRDLLTGFRVASTEAKGPVVLLSHAELGTAIADSGQPMSGRCDIEVSDGDLLDSGADYVALGHIHKHQILGDGHICYAGSPRPTRWGEPGPKGYCLVDIQRGEKPEIEFVEVPHRAMVDIIACWEDGELKTENEICLNNTGAEMWTIPKGADIRLTYKAFETEQHAAAIEAKTLRDKWLADGARAVKLAPKIIPKTRVRSETIRTAKTTEERLLAYWDDSGLAPERKDSILAKLQEIEAEVAP